MTYALVADIGGTNSRFALCKTSEIELYEPRKYPNKEFASLADVIEHYLKEVGEQPIEACLAVAGPIQHDRVKLTNIAWEFSREEYQQHFAWKRLLLKNDFTAMAMSVPHLAPQNIKQIGGGTAMPHMPISVLGPGTGLGVSGLLPQGDRWIALQGEGGNIDFSPFTDEEIDLFRIARSELGHVRVEDFVSGSGLSYLHEVRLQLHGKPRERLKAEEIAWRAKMEHGGVCYDTIHLFCGMLGSFAGSQAMILGAFGGVYIGGGVAPQLEELFETSPFRTRFEAKGRFHDYVKTIPTFMMLSHSRNALIGAAALLR